MAFGIDKEELNSWKQKVIQGEIAFLTHYWQDERFPSCYTVTKVGCIWLPKLIQWGEQYGLHKKWIHRHHSYPHYDLFGKRQKDILEKEYLYDHIKRFNL